MFFPFSFWNLPKIRTDLIAFYNFNNCANLGLDSHINRLNLSYNSAAFTCSPGVISNCAVSTTATEKMDRTDTNKVFNLNTDKTFVYWFNVAAANSANYLCGKSNFPSASVYYMQVNVNTVYFSLSTDTETDLRATASDFISSSQWYFLVAQHFSATKRFTIQINNGTIASNSYTGNILNPSDINFNGIDYNTAAGNVSIDSLGIWRRILTNTEITYLYNSGLGREYPF